jgi:predicted GH43/DUF377 family glycosyl hydrolase
MVVRRFEANPLIRIEDVRPSVDDAFVFGVFNCGATRFKDEVLLLVRIAEKPIPREGYLSTFAVVPEDGELRLRRHDVPAGNPAGLNYLGSWCPPYHSHMRVARSKDGVHFELDTKVSVPFQGPYDEFGMEDPRIVKIGDRYYINYSAISRPGVNTVLLSTTDFVHYENHGIIFCTDNKDVALFPEKVGGYYYALHRPGGGLVGPGIWIARSPDLIHWGGHSHLLSPRRGKWDQSRVGCGSAPIKTEKGWLAICHGAIDNPVAYCLSLLLLDLEDPTKVLAYSNEPFMRAEAPYEHAGYLPNVIFQCGHLEEDGRIVIYYGACDDKVCAAETHVDELLAFLLGG